jgi:radical SAM protein with 4Fe4S-binding SPASM domain
MISIVTTNACNLRCEYCFEHNKINRNITFETIKKFIDYVSDNTKRWNYGRPFAVAFLGGEPLLNLNIIEETMKYIQIKNILVNSNIELLSGGATTNIVAATRKEFKDFYKKYPFFELYGSMDGCPSSHDASRRHADGTGSAAEILKDWAWVAESLKSINFVLTRKNIHLFAESMIFLNSFFKKKVLLLLENEGLIFDENWLEVYLQQIEILKQWHKDTKIQNTLALPSTEYGPCTMCDDLELAIHPSGDITPCWTLGDIEELSLGNINHPETLKVDNYRPCQVAEKYRKKLEGLNGYRCLSRTIFGLRQLERERKKLNPKVFNAILGGLGDLCRFLNELGLNKIGQSYAKALELEAALMINNASALKVGD